MKLRLRTKDFRLTFYFPTAWICSRPGLLIGLFFARKYVRVAKLESAVLALKKLKSHKGLVLVDVRTSDGDLIAVIL